MNKGIRFYIAMVASKSALLALKILKRRASYMPGYIAIKLCPNFLDLIDKPEKVVGVTGTNGKTTVTNLIVDILDKQGESFICNREGSNIAGGIATSLLANSTVGGKSKKQMAVFELDERSCIRIFPYIGLDTLIITNVFRDSYKRNAHTEYIFNLLKDNISPNTKLILNGNDPVCYNFGNEKSVYFGMLPQEFEDGIRKNIVCDGAVCPNCSATLTYDFVRYHHIGLYHCEECGFKVESIKYMVENIALNDMTMTLRVNDNEYLIKLIDNNIINIYNQVCAIAMLCELGYDLNNIISITNDMEIVKSRLHSKNIGQKQLVNFIAKGQNPIACSRAFESSNTFSGKKCVVLLLDDHFDAMESVENIAWYYDTDFEFLNSDEINQIVVQGVRRYDVLVRLLMAGISHNKIVCVEDLNSVGSNINYSISDTFIIYFDIYLDHEADNVHAQLENKLKEISNEN